MDNSWVEWMAMNGYGIYIWPSYGFAALVLWLLYVYLSRRVNTLELQANDEAQT